MTEQDLAKALRGLASGLDDICRDSNPDWTEKRVYPNDVLDDIHKQAVGIRFELLPQILAALEARGDQAALLEGARLERERIVAWLRDASDDVAEALCTDLWAEVKRQREDGTFVGQPYFDLFAEAIKEQP